MKLNLFDKVIYEDSGEHYPIHPKQGGCYIRYDPDDFEVGNEYMVIETVELLKQVGTVSAVYLINEDSGVICVGVEGVRLVSEYAYGIYNLNGLFDKPRLSLLDIMNNYRRSTLYDNQHNPYTIYNLDGTNYLSKYHNTLFTTGKGGGTLFRLLDARIFPGLQKEGVYYCFVDRGGNFDYIAQSRVVNPAQYDKEDLDDRFKIWIKIN